MSQQYPQGWQPPQQYNPQQYPPQQYPPQQWQQPQPARIVTQQGLGPFWTMFHLFMTCMTFGMWGIIWYWHYRSRRSVTTYR